MVSEQSGLAGITQLLMRIQNGEAAAREELVCRIHDSMRRLAHGLIEGERDGSSLHTTALVNEAVLKLMSGPALRGINDRVHLFRLVSQIMRHILIDRSRNRMTDKRGGNRSRVSVEEAENMSAQSEVASVVDLAEALAVLEEKHERASTVVHLRYFGGHTIPEIAQALHVSTSTVESDWRFARAWLFARFKCD